MTGLNPRRHGAGSRRRIAQIRWTRREIVHAVILLVAAAAFCIWIGFWLATHKFD